MEERNLIGFGTSSLIITLPSSWVKKNNLKKGEKVFLSEQNGKITISKSSYEKRSQKQISISAEDKKIDMVKSEIISAYINNYDVIEIIDSKKKGLEKIKEIIHDLSGVEILEETATKIVVKYLTDIRELSIDGLVRRIDIILRSMIDDALLCFKEDLHDSIYQRDINVNRLVLLTHRTIRFIFENTEFLNLFKTNNIELLESFDVSTSLEKIADQIKRISKIIASKKIPDKKKFEIEKMLITLKERYLLVMKSYYSRDKRLAFELEHKTTEIILDCNKILDQRCEIDLIRLVEFLKGISAHTKFIARVTIDSQKNK